MDRNAEMQEAEIHPMDEAATHAVVQGWCEPESSHMERDVVLAMAIAKPVGRLLRHWYDTAMGNQRNTDYYRGLVEQIGKMLGDEAYISDDGSRQQDVLCAKVPELVKTKLGEEIRVVFDGPPGHVAGRFVEVEDVHGASVSVGEWHNRDDGLWELRIPGVVVNGRS